MTISPEWLFKGVSLKTPLRSAIGTAMVPGSTRALNRQTGRLEGCTPMLCPHAVLERTYDGSEVLVNRAPHFGIGSFSGVVNSFQDKASQQAMYSFWSFMSEPIYSKQLVMAPGVVGPYRKSHLDTSAPSLAAWATVGYDQRAVKDFLTTVKGSLEHPNFVPDLRMLGGKRYMGTLYTALLNASAGMAPAQITANVAAEHAAILASSGPRDTGTTKGSSDRQLAIILGVIIPLVVVLAALLATMFIVRHRRRSLFRRHWVRSSGENTTLVVTDIMDSTALWETLAPGVMECAVATHNAVVRQALDAWDGMGPSAALQAAGNSDGRFALLRAALLLAPSDAPFSVLSGVEVVLADPTRTRQLDKARELLQSLHAESLSSYTPHGDAHVTSTMAKFMQLAWILARGGLEGSSAAAAVAMDQATVFKGLRVRIGMHSGVQTVDVERNATSGREVFGGVLLAAAKTVGDAGAGGMVLLSQETFKRLQPDSSLKNVLMLALGEYGLKDDNLGPVCLYQAIERSLVPRLAAFEPLRGLSEIEAGVMDAPIGTVAIAFANLVGLATLQAWDRNQADVALNVYAAMSKQLLHDAGGYLVELTSSGLCLAAFCHPLGAIAWRAGLIEVMKHHQWGEELLGHDLCEEVLLHEPTSKGRPTSPHTSRVLFRGPRIKIGIDVGKVQAEISPVTGRMTYRGRVMNRAARISGKLYVVRLQCVP
ncbi:hypothetical protein FOA52_004669 [Chlamydomonas sp. UWO 241]|nr:hypothetical protein FOA52_004669 [Chlamydomonas sp. UWO 241]